MYNVIRSAAFSGFTELLDQLGVPAGAILEQAGLSPALLSERETSLPASKFILCLRLAATQTGRQDFGLMLSRQQDWTMLGAVGLMAEHSESVLDALDILIKFAKLHNSGSVIDLQRYHGKALLTYDDLTPIYPRDPQICDLALGYAMGVMSASNATAWIPENAYFMHREPADLEVFRDTFKCPLHFNQEVYALEFDDRALAAALPNSNHLRRIYLGYYVERLRKDMLRREKNADTVGYLVHTLLPSGQCSEASIASLLNINTRTLQRRLSAEDTSFNTILGNIRSDLARQYLLETQISLTNMAAYLGYSELSAFSRFFKQRFGCTASEYRNQSA